MDQIRLLWEYQQADMEVSKMENSIKRSPNRQKLVKYRDYLVSQQNVMKRIESEVSAMADRLEALKDAISMTEDQYKALKQKVESDQATDAKAVQQLMNEAKRFLNNLTAYEQEIKRIRKDAADRERLQHDVKVRAAKAKAEFDKLKVAFDAEYKEKTVELEGLKAKAAELAKPVEAAFMDRYEAIKRHSVPPLAKLNGDQCTGCNMSLPSAVTRKIKAGELIECETCGRLLVIL
ncbi:MAG: hypothetical protein IJ968_06735 [Clostridia bacterium]|nr:hypothetical protein [Clostridia bacterium]